jgi:hypothetical protein
MLCRLVEESKGDIGFGTIKKLGIRNCFLVQKERLAQAFLKY